VVPVGDLIEELWSGTPPRSARTTLQTYVLQLRELIATALAPAPGADAARPAPRTPKDLLATAPGGYLLTCAGGRSDVRDFEHLTGQGYRAMDAGDFAGASRTLHGALRLWTGDAFADVPAGPQLALEAARLHESRLCALDQRIEADLRLGRHRELLAEMTVLASRHPTHENLHAQYMLALYRSGRRGEALDAYQRLRATLVRTLGLEPSAALSKLQRSILRSGPGPVPARHTPAGHATTAPATVGPATVGPATVGPATLGPAAVG
ncbi:BTAD domain-containing putative transcriptional regulator, partial [Streptomyces solisilvae]|uniref:AfsR/SARP family transcriptional regulator n=1 Tax=Streptomyces malaysiensis TaxID=92644 RepID=UPI00369A3072